MPADKPRLLAQVKGRMRARHLSPRTERADLGWIIRHIRYHGTRHPAELGETKIIAYLTHRAAERRLAEGADATRDIPKLVKDLIRDRKGRVN